MLDLSSRHPPGPSRQLKRQQAEQAAVQGGSDLRRLGRWHRFAVPLRVAAIPLALLLVRIRCCLARHHY